MSTKEIVSPKSNISKGDTDNKDAGKEKDASTNKHEKGGTKEKVPARLTTEANPEG